MCIIDFVSMCATETWKWVRGKYSHASLNDGDMF